MNKKVLLAGASVVGTLGLGFATINEVSASEVSPEVTPMNRVFHSGGQTLEIYSDPGLTQKTGRKLDSNITEWQVYNSSTSGATGSQYGISSDSGIITYDLGGGQWVAGLEIQDDFESLNIAGAFTQAKDVPVYSNPELSQQIGTLPNNITQWKINRIMTIVTGIYAADLGHNQWVAIDEFGMKDNTYLLRQAYLIKNNSTLYNQNGQPTGTLKFDDSEMGYQAYKVFRIQKLNGHLYGCLGSDNQWVDMRNSLIN